MRHYVDRCGNRFVDHGMGYAPSGMGVPAYQPRVPMKLLSTEAADTGTGSRQYQRPTQFVACANKCWQQVTGQSPSSSEPVALTEEMFTALYDCGCQSCAQFATPGGPFATGCSRPTYQPGPGPGVYVP